MAGAGSTTSDVDEAIEREHMRARRRRHRAADGRAAARLVHRPHQPERTQRLVAEHGGFLYDADSYADDLPYWVKVDGPRPLIVPYTLDANDMRFATAQGFNSGDQFFAYLRDTFDVLYAEGADAPKMMSVGLHCRLAGRPGRFAALERFLDHVAEATTRSGSAAASTSRAIGARVHPPQIGRRDGDRARSWHWTQSRRSGVMDIA